MIDRSKTTDFLFLAIGSIDPYRRHMGETARVQCRRRAAEGYRGASGAAAIAATAMSDVYEATGLKPGSLYAAFKDKEHLFRRCFEAYAAFFRQTLPTDRSGVAAIEAWLALQARLAAEDPDAKAA